MSSIIKHCPHPKWVGHEIAAADGSGKVMRICAQCGLGRYFQPTIVVVGWEAPATDKLGPMQVYIPGIIGPVNLVELRKGK
jgi:hypothetical protein